MGLRQTIYFTDLALAAIESSIGLHEPEKGGALLGPPGLTLVTEFLFDEEAITDSVTYCPSERLKQEVPEHESRTCTTYMGIVHSHPGAMDHPSDQDLRSTKVELEANPQVPVFLLPIVTHRFNGKLLPHELPLGRGKITIYCGERGRGGNVLLTTGRAAAVIPIYRHLKLLAQALHIQAEPEIDLTTYDGVQLIAGHLSEPNLEIDFLVGLQYPFLPPIVIITASDGESVQLHLKWDLDLEPDERLLRALRPVIAGSPPYQWAYGPSSGPALTTDLARATKAGWTGRFASEDPSSQAGSAFEALFARSQGIVSQSLRQQRVTVFGVGTVGTYLTEVLVRAGVGSLIIVDPDTVGSENLCRTAYSINDLGMRKVDALTRIAINISPNIEVRSIPADVHSFEIEELAALIQGSDLVIAATDSPDAQALINHVAYHESVPSVFCALYRQALGGEVLFVVPEETACYTCATRARQGTEADGDFLGRRNYGTGRLEGEFALAPDIHHVASAAGKVALSLLSIGIEGASLSSFLLDPLCDGANYLVFSNDQEFWFLPKLFRDYGVPSQYAYQAAWMKPVRDPECPICGLAALRSIPLKKLKLEDTCGTTQY